MYIMYICVLFLSIATRGFPEFPSSLCRSVGDVFAFLGKRCIEEVWHETLQEMWRRQSFGNGACWKENEGRQGNVMFKNRRVNQ